MKIGLDIETYDPCLKSGGYSWKYNQGKILCTALYYEDTGEKREIAGLYNENSPFTEDERKRDNGEIKKLLMSPDVTLVGANIMYDLGWLLSEYDMKTSDVKASLLDVLVAESSINEFEDISLEKLSLKYLHHGKDSSEAEQWVSANVPHARGDFRKYLTDVPWEILSGYVKGDAEYPCLIWKIQEEKLLQEGLRERVQLDFDCILPILCITKNGFPIDLAEKERNTEILTHWRDELKKEFRSAYGRDISFNSGKQLASFFDEEKIPYRVKITLKGWRDRDFAGYDDMDRAGQRARRICSSFRFVKRIPVALVPSDKAQRTLALLEEDGLRAIANPSIDAKYLEANRDAYPALGTIADCKKADSILSKVLCTEYNRFISHDKDGVDRAHSQYHITKAEHAGTISSRLSSSHANLQQLPSKGSLTVRDGDTLKEISFPALTRALFKCEKGGVFFKLDYSQLEYRLICHCAMGEGAEEVRRQFNENPRLDFHQYVCELTGLTRKYAKNMSFGISFGLGLKSMAENFGWTMEQASEIAEQYHHHMPFVQPTLDAVGEVAKRRGYIRTVLGSHARLRNANLAYTMLNRFTQGSGADILKSAIRQSYREGLWEHLVIHNTVHDELDGTVYPTEDSVRALIRLEKIMETTVPLRVPLLAEAEFGMNWNDVREVKEWLDMKKECPDSYQEEPEELRKVIELYNIIKQEAL